MTDLNKARQILMEKRDELRNRIAGTQAIERHETEDDTMEGKNDDAQLSEASEIRDGLDSQATAELIQVNNALTRVEEGRYGTCTSCAKPIGEERLEALPYASMCITCAEHAGQGH